MPRAAEGAPTGGAQAGLHARRDDGCSRRWAMRVAELGDAGSGEEARLANERGSALRPRHMSDRPEIEEQAVECFDPRLAEHATLTVRVDQVIDPLEVTHARERIDEYRRAMQDGVRFPPISVVRLAGRLFVADGHKRFQAYRTLGRDEIAVELWPKRRWLADQWDQLRRATFSQASLLLRLPHDPKARTAARRLFWDTIGHWRRMVASAVRFVLRGRKKRFSADGRR